MDTATGDLVREARKAAGLTQRELAALTGVSQPHVSAYENGRRQPTVPTMSRLIEATGHRLILGLERVAQRPLTLVDVARELTAERSEKRGGGWYWIREFLRGFADDAASTRERQALITGEPPFTGDVEWDAILAACAEHLAYHHGLDSPQWTQDDRRVCPRAWFLSALPSQRAWAVETSPASFRRRNLFVLPEDVNVT